MENQVVAQFNAVVSVEDCVSSKGKSYRAVFVTVNGKKIQVGFYNAYTENGILKAGIKIKD